jgi:hypothetical protein
VGDPAGGVETDGFPDRFCKSGGHEAAALLLYPFGRQRVSGNEEGSRSDELVGRLNKEGSRPDELVERLDKEIG